MRLCILLVLGCLLWKSIICVMSTKSVDEHLVAKFQFQLFENFNVCRDVYLKEIKVLKKLLEVRQNLLEAKRNLRDILKSGDNSISENMLPSVKGKLSSTIDIISELSKVQTNEYPTDFDVMGSIKAMFILHSSYDLNMTAAVHEGKLSYQDHHGIHREYQAYEKFNVMDVISIADKALENRDYALAIDLTRHIIKMLKHNKGKILSKNDKKIFKKVEWLKKNLMKANNEYIEKNKSYIGKGHRTLQYLVDKDLKRKKKQPTFITNNDIYKVTHYRPGIFSIGKSL